MNLLLRDPTSFEKLFRSQYNALVAGAYRILNDKARAEDVVQDVFLKLWQKRDEIKVDENLPAYLHRAVVNHAINIYKQQYRKLIEHTDEIAEQTDTTGSHADNSLITTELNEKIERAIATMPDSSRGVFMLSRFEEMSYKEIAEKLEISVKTVEKHMSNALKHLRNYLPVLVCLIIKVVLAVKALPF
ncbi:MAG: RNA polymerase sigma-70 factor [Chitinophagales bacterium]|nr:RNA polymerase sigma-70 factor [Chitinophagales bacterium]